MRFLFYVCCFCSAVLFPVLQGADELLLAATFEGSYDAAFSRGDGRAVLPEALRSVPADGALALPPNQWFCYPAPGNIDLESGTIVMEVTPDFTPGEGALPSGRNNAQLFSIRNRVGHRLNGNLIQKTGMLHFFTSDGSGKTTSVKVPVKGWKRGETRVVTFAWQKPSRAFVAVQGLGSGSSNAARLPECPVESLYDIYFGSNSQVKPIQQYGELGTFPGKIGAIRIYRGCRPEIVTKLPAFSLCNRIPAWPEHATQNPEWIGANRRRINFHLSAPKQAWKTNPVKLPLDLSEKLAGLSGAERRRSIDGIRLVVWDPATGKPRVHDAAQKGDDRFFVPFQASPGFYSEGRGELAFSCDGPFPAACSVYFDEKTPYSGPFPAGYPTVGVGFPLMLGSKEKPARFGGGLRGAFALHDYDGDGKPDLLFLSGSQTDSGRDLWGGLYFHRNLGKGVFAPPELVGKGNNPLGEYSQTAPPIPVDIDGDGKTELVFASKYLCGYAKVELRGGVPHPVDWKALAFDGPRPPLVSSATLFDWNGDGKLDLITDGNCHLNIGTASEPLFSSAPTDIFIPGVRGETEKSTHRDVHNQRIIRNAEGENIRPLAWTTADIDGDGRTDLVCGGWTSRLYWFPCQADGRFGKPRLLTAADGEAVKFPGVFPFPVFCDIDSDGAFDLLLSSEDGTLGVCRNRAKAGEALRLDPPEFLTGFESPVNAGALAVPVAFDWDGDGDLDLIVGSANGRIYLFENAGTADAPRYLDPVPLRADGSEICLQAGKLGSVQGEQEADWGYVTVEVADWDGDGLPDVIASGVRGDHTFFRNVGKRTEPKLTNAGLIEVDWPGETPHPSNLRFKPAGKELLTVHRCRPNVIDWNGDGLPDYITMDHRDQMAFYERFRGPDGTLGLKPGVNPFTINAPFFGALVWNHQSLTGVRLRPAMEGRCSMQFADWDGDGKVDLIMDNINGRFLRNESPDYSDHPTFVDHGDLASERLANHNASPYAADWDGDGKLDLIVGTEDGTIRFFSRAYLEKDVPGVIRGANQEKPVSGYDMRNQPTAALDGWKVEVDSGAVGRSGEPAVFRIGLRKDGEFVSGHKLFYSFRSDNGPGGKGEWTSAAEPLIFEITPSAPGYTLLKVDFYLPDGRKIYGRGGLIADPEKIRPGGREPQDLDAFWEARKQAVRSEPMQPVETRVCADSEGRFEVWDVAVGTPGTRPVRGYLTKPAGEPERKYPALVTWHAAGVRSAFRQFHFAGKGLLVFDVNAHGLDNGGKAEDYLQLYRTTMKNYRFENAHDRDKIYFNGMFSRVIRALDYIKSRPDWDGRTLIVYGASQGGAQALVSAGLDDAVSAMIAVEPAMCDHGAKLAGRQPGWPKFSQLKNQSAVSEAVSYYDAAFFAARIRRARCLVIAGLIDTTCEPPTVYAAFNAIRSKEKLIINYPQAIHGAYGEFDRETDAFLDRLLRDSL